MSDLQKIKIDLKAPGAIALLRKQWESEYYALSEDERRRRLLDMKAEDYNKHPGTDSDCKICSGKCLIMVPDYAQNICLIKNCACMVTMQNMRLISDSGLADLLTENTFDNFKTDKSFAAELKKSALSYLADSKPSEWFVTLGQSGAGKTHLCTALCAEYINRSFSVRYLRWLTEGKKLKQLSKKGEGYYEGIFDFEDCDVLYIDDLFKRASGEAVSSADLRLALELVNYRIATGKRTIISGEDLLNNLFAVDEALAGRINKQAGKYLIQIEPDINKNFRFKTL